MTTNKNRLRIDFKDMPDMKAALGAVEPGTRFKMEYDLVVVANSDDYIEADIEMVEVELTDDEGEVASVSAEPSADEPVMVEVMRRAKAKKSGPASEPEEDAEEEPAA